MYGSPRSPPPGGYAGFPCPHARRRAAPRVGAAAVAVLEWHRAEIDRINVFPVADADTGTNLLLTMRAGRRVRTPPSRARTACRGPRARRAPRRARQLRGDPLPGVAGGGRGRGGRRRRPCAGAPVLADALDRGARAAPRGRHRPAGGHGAHGARRGGRRGGGRAIGPAGRRRGGRGRRRAHRAARHPGPAARAGSCGGGRRGRVSASYVLLDALAALVTGRAPADAPDARPIPHRSGGSRRVRLSRASRRPHRPRRPVRLRGHVPARRRRTTGGPSPSAPRSTGSATRSPSSATVPRTAAGPGTSTCTARTSGPRWRPGWRRADRTASGWCPWFDREPECRSPVPGPCSHGVRAGDGRAGPRRRRGRAGARLRPPGRRRVAEAERRCSPRRWPAPARGTSPS